MAQENRYTFLLVVETKFEQGTEEALRDVTDFISGLNDYIIAKCLIIGKEIKND